MKLPHIGKMVHDLVKVSPYTSRDFAAKMDIKVNALFNRYNLPHWNTEWIRQASDLLGRDIELDYVAEIKALNHGLSSGKPETVSEQIEVIRVREITKQPWKAGKKKKK